MLRDSFPKAYKPKPIRKMPAVKPVLEVERLAFFRVHYSILEAYVETVFGFEFDYLFAAGVTNGPAVEYRITGQKISDAWDRKAQDLREGRRTKDVNLILNVLARDGYILPGHYTVATSKLPDPVTLYTDLLRQTGSPADIRCLAFREKHRGDKTFVQRASMLDKAFTEQAVK